MRRRSVAVVAATVMLGGIATSAGAAGPVPGVLQGRPGIAVAGNAHVLATLAAGTTRVQRIRDRDGKALRTRVLAGKLGVPQVTFSGTVEGTWANGRRVLLSTSMYDNASSTRFVVLETRTLKVLRTIVLRGAFAFDALSPDGRRLYMTQFPNGFNGPIRYVVRSLNLTSGKLEPGAIVDKTEPGEQMAGIPLARTWSGDGASAFTLYSGLKSHAFIHALDTTKRSARCIDLPWSGDAQTGLERVRMSVTKDGTLVLSYPGVGVLARIDTHTFDVEVVNDPS